MRWNFALQQAIAARYRVGEARVVAAMGTSGERPPHWRSSAPMASGFAPSRLNATSVDCGMKGAIITHTMRNASRQFQRTRASASSAPDASAAPA